MYVCMYVYTHIYIYIYIYTYTYMIYYITWGTGTPGKSTGSSAKRFMTISTKAQLTPRTLSFRALGIGLFGV